MTNCWLVNLYFNFKSRKKLIFLKITTCEAQPSRKIEQCDCSHDNCDGHVIVLLHTETHQNA